VDGIGNICIIGGSSCTALKYSPTGQYLDQFSGEAPHSGSPVPGKVFNPSGIGVDGVKMGKGVALSKEELQALVL
jgi:hypothetical protein